MSNPYIGEIRLFGGNFAPAGWALCQGQLLPISEYDALFALIGTTYGGDGQSTFALPNLMGRVPVHQGNGYIIGEAGGVEAVTLTVQQIPAHTHPLIASILAGTTPNPVGAVLAQTPPGIMPYIQETPSAPMSPGAIGVVGGSQPHANIQPYQCLNFIISLYGVFPQQS